MIFFVDVVWYICMKVFKAGFSVKTNDVVP